MEVRIAYDPEADVWYVAETNVHGLCLEADSPGKLFERIGECVDELIEMNGQDFKNAASVGPA